MKRKQKNEKKRKIGRRKNLLAICLAVMLLTLNGCNPVRTVLGVGELYGDTAQGLILVLLDSGDLEKKDGDDPTNKIYIGSQEKPDEIPDVPDHSGGEDETEGDGTDADDENGDDETDADDANGEDETDADDSNGDDTPDDTDSEEDFRKPQVDYYAYSTLTSEAKDYYDQMLDCIEDYKKSIVVYGADEDTVLQISHAILADHGDLFWYDGTFSYSEFEKNGEPATTFEPQYIITEEEKKTYEQQIDTIESEWLSGISSKASDYEKVKYVYEQLVNRVTYDLDAENNQNIMSTFLNERTVCAGFSHAAQTMLQDLGVSCTYLNGKTADGGLHAWNLVCVDDVYYYMDVTWGNPSCTNESGTGEPNYVDYSYLNMTYEEISKDHICENEFSIPETNATEANYFVMEDLYFTTDDFSRVGEAVSAASEAGENLQIKFATDDLFTEAVNELIVQKELYAYCPDLEGYTYSFREDAKTILFFFDESVL